MDDFDLEQYGRRHPGIRAILRYFDFRHLDGVRREVSSLFWDAAQRLLNAIEDDSPELTVCLRKLLEAKDCAVRASLDSLG